RDELYEAAVDVVIREGRGSVSLLQRALGIGYGRAARLVDYMAEDGIVGEYNGSQAREVLLTIDQWEQMNGQPASAPSPRPPAPPRSGRVLTVAARSPREIDDEGDAEDEPYESDEEADEVDAEIDEAEDSDEAEDELEDDQERPSSPPHYRRGRESA
ncbi:MAG: DNA translocase FtsK, partial [Pirellulales bacterium]